MRVLVTTSPGLGHMFATVPLTWAFRAAGHEVLMATAGRAPGDIPAIVGAGLEVAEIASIEEIGEARKRLWADRQSRADALGLTMEEMVEKDIETARQARNVTDGNGFAFAARIFGPMSEATLDGLVHVAQRWRPDLVIFESSQGGGPLIAALLDVPAVEHPIGFARGPQLVEALRECLAGSYGRLGVREPPRRMEALDVSPPSMAVGPGYGRLMRYVPFNGGGTLPAGLESRPGRPRIALTLGSILPGQFGIGPLRPIVEAVKDFDVEIVLTAGGLSPDALGELPSNVRPTGYVPLAALLRTCDACVHHGGSATTLTTLDAGLPQLVLPQLADQFINAEAVRRRGCGIAAEHDDVDAAMIRRLLEDGEMRAAAAEVKAEMATLPPPASLVPELAELAAPRPSQRHR